MKRGWPLPGKKTASGVGPCVWHRQAWTAWCVPEKAGCKSGWRSSLDGAVAGEVFSWRLSATRQGQLCSPVSWLGIGTFELWQQLCEQHRSFETRGMGHVFPTAKGSRKNAATSVAEIRFTTVDEMLTWFFPI
jgi:hypothetical protein